jgi:hypothetical protein
VTVILIVSFTVLLPSTFLTILTFRSILSDQSIVALVSLAQMIPLAASKFDLSVGYGIGLAHILSVGFQVEAGLPWQIAILLVCAIGLLVGIINGLLVEAAQIDSFIATLGTGSILYAISIAYTGGQQIVGQLPSGFTAINDVMIFGVPAPAVYVLVLAVSLDFLRISTDWPIPLCNWRESPSSATRGGDYARCFDYVNTPLADTAARMPQNTTSLLQRFGKGWTTGLGINDLYFDFASPALRSVGIPSSGPPTFISAGDGSVAAFNRVRSGEYQIGTVAEPLHEAGWQLVDELNRALSGQPPSGYVAPVHLVTKDNIQYDGGPNNIYDPDNNYQMHYKTIWGK